MSFLSAVGRSGVGKAIQDYSIDQGNTENKKAIQDLTIQGLTMDLEAKKRKDALAIEQEKDLNTVVPAEIILAKFEGGHESPMAKMVYDLAKQNGFIDESIGGLGSITKRDAQKVGQMMSEPEFMSKLSRTRIGYWRNAYNQAAEALKQKPDDEKLKAALSHAETGLKQAIGQDKAYRDGHKDIQEDRQGEENLPEGYHKVGSKLYKEGEGGNLQLVPDSESKTMHTSDGSDGLMEGTVYLKTDAGDIEILQEPENKSLKTIMEAYLQSNPNPTEKDLIEFTRKLAQAKETGKNGVTMTMPDGTVLQVGGEKNNLNAPVETKLQKDIVGLEQQLSDLKDVGESFKKEYLSYGGKLKRVVLKQMDKIDPQSLDDEQRQFIQGARRFTEGVEQSFNAYRKEVTGAQAAMREISMLRDSILNKKLTPSEFEASFNRYIKQIQRGLALKKHFLAKGITGKELGEKIDTNILVGNDVADIRGDEIYLELKQQGVPEDQLKQMVLEQLKKEGF